MITLSPETFVVAVHPGAVVAGLGGRLKTAIGDQLGAAARSRHRKRHGCCLRDPSSRTHESDAVSSSGSRGADVDGKGRQVPDPGAAIDDGLKLAVTPDGSPAGAQRDGGIETSGYGRGDGACARSPLLHSKRGGRGGHRKAWLATGTGCQDRDIVDAERSGLAYVRGGVEHQVNGLSGVRAQVYWRGLEVTPAVLLEEVEFRSLRVSGVASNVPALL